MSKETVGNQEREKKTSSASKLCTILTLTYALQLNDLRAHLQISQWNEILKIDPPELDPVKYGFQPDLANKIMLSCRIPQKMLIQLQIFSSY